MQVVDDLLHIPYSGKLLREKTFVNFTVFSVKFGSMASFGPAKTLNPQKLSL